MAGNLTLVWVIQSTNQVEQRLYRKIDSGVEELIETLNATVTTYEDVGVLAAVSATVEYRVVSVGIYRGEETLQSSPVQTFTKTTIPPFPGTVLMKFTKDQTKGDIRVGIATENNVNQRSYVVNDATGKVEAEIVGYTIASIGSGDWTLYCKPSTLSSGVTVGDLVVKVSGAGLIRVDSWSEELVKSAWVTNQSQSNGTSSNLISVPTTRPNSTQTDFNNFFYGCTLLNDPNISNWDMSGAIFLNRFFMACRTFNQPLNNWNVSTVQYFNEMFYGARVFNQPLNNWNVSAGEAFNSMFYNAAAFNQSLNTWNMANATNMNNMFYGATVFNQPLNNWNVGKVTNMSGMFYNAAAFNQDLTGWCVTNITATPSNFGAASALIPANYPVWGTCPPR